MNAVMLTPEPPYPLYSGGAFRTASLLHYFARVATVDLIFISETGQPALLPPGLVSSQHVIALPPHSKSLLRRYIRNAIRAARGVPPLIDRLANLETSIERALSGHRYDFGIIEHFWCAPYVDQLEKSCGKTVLNLHNVESVLHQRCAAVSGGFVRAGHARFAAASRTLEAGLLPRFSHVLAASEADADALRKISSDATVQVYPNSLPLNAVPERLEKPHIIFTANFEYHPNIDAVGFLVHQIWPLVRKAHPELCLRLVGRGDQFIRGFVPRDSGIETTGPVPDTTPEIAQALLAVAPLRAGSGTRIKILEAWAASRAVIATPLGAEGLEARDGFNIAFASNASQFAQKIESLLADSLLRRELGANGRRTFEASYCWEAAWGRLRI